MAGKAFDFEEFNKLKLSDYKKNHCKPMVLKKKKAAIFLIDYSLDLFEAKCIMISFKKYAEASKAFKQLKKDKTHPLNSVALASIEVATEAGANKLKVDLKAGNLKAERLLKKSKILQDKWLQMDLEVVTGLATDEQEETKSDGTTSQTSQEQKTTKKEEETQKVEKKELTDKQRVAYHKKLDELTAFFNKLADKI